MTSSPRPRGALTGSRRDVLAVAAMSVALVAAGGIIAALCLGLATPAGVAAAALADILACAAVALAVAGYITEYPACPRLAASSSRPGRRPVPRGRAARAWEQDTLDEADWQRWEREVFGGPAQPPSRRPPTVSDLDDGEGTS